MINYHTELPDKQAFFSLLATTGWNETYHTSPDELLQAAANSWYTLSAYDDDTFLVGSGRIVSDRVLHAMIYELIVLPEYRSKGIGGEILARLVRHCQEAGIRDIQLFCAAGKRPFYEKRGFAARPENAPGMYYVGIEKVEKTS